MTTMVARKYSASMSEELLDGVREAARAEGVTVSAWISAAVEDRLGLIGLERLIADWEAEHGEIPEAEMAEAHRLFTELQTTTELVWPPIEEAKRTPARDAESKKRST